MESNFKIKSEKIHKQGVIGYSSQLKRDFQIHFLKQQGLQPHHKLLDVGCGTLRGGIPIIDYLNENNYFGTEMRKLAYDCAMQELDLYPSLKAKNPSVVISDFTEFETEQRFDFIWAFAVLFHVPDSNMLKFFAQIKKYLTDDGIFYGNIAHETHSKWGKDLPNNPQYPMLYRPLEFYQEAAEANSLVIKDIGPNSQYGHVGHSFDEDEQRMLKIQRG